MQHTITLEIDTPIKNWLLAELELGELYNAIDAAGDDHELIAELDAEAAPLANRIVDMGFTNEDAFKFVLTVAAAIKAA